MILLSKAALYTHNIIAYRSIVYKYFYVQIICAQESL